MLEVECKIKVEEHEVVRERLRAAGATYVGRVIETNTILDREDGSLREAGCGLRVRSIVLEDGEGPQPSLTFKGPRQPGAMKVREEIETGVDDPEAAISILRSLGYSCRLVFEKTRESWRLDGCMVELDELAELGCFVEIEGADASAVNDAVTRLGLDPEAVEPRSYVAMLVSH